MKTLFEQYKEFYSTKDSSDRPFSKNLNEPNFFYFLYFYLTDKKQEEPQKKDFFSSYEKWYPTLSITTENYEHIKLILYSARILRNTVDDLYEELAFCIKYAIENPFFFYEYGENSEDWINNLIWQDKEKLLLHPYLLNNKKSNELGYKIIIYLIRHFFLLRFDFESVNALLKAIILNKEHKILKNKNEWGSNLFKNYSALLRALIPFIIIFYTAFTKPFNFSLFNINLPFTFVKDSYRINSETTSVALQKVQYNSIIGLTELFALILIFVCLCVIWKNQESIYKFSPRLFIGIIVGYIPIMAESTFWNLGLSLSVGNSIVMIILTALASLSLTYLYLKYEVIKGTNSSDKKLIFNRTFNFFSKGIVYSFFIGLIINDLFTPVMLRSALTTGTLNIIEDQGNLHAAIFGIIDPLMVLFYFPLALFIGIVVQFIWEEKPITHPIK